MVVATVEPEVIKEHQDLHRVPVAAAQVVEVARQQELQLAVLLAGSAPRLQQTLLDTDWCVALPANRTGQAHLLLLMALQGLADGLDLQLLGNDSAEGETA